MYIRNLPPSRKLSKLDKSDIQDTAGEAGTSLQVMYSNGPPHMTGQKQDDQLEHTFSRYVRIRGCNPEDLLEAMNDREKWRERSGISVLAARHDDDDQEEAKCKQANSTS